MRPYNLKQNNVIVGKHQPYAIDKAGRIHLPAYSILGNFLCSFLFQITVYALVLPPAVIKGTLRCVSRVEFVAAPPPEQCPVR